MIVGIAPIEMQAQRLHYETLYVQFMLERGRKMLELIFMTPAGETVLNGEVWLRISVECIVFLASTRKEFSHRAAN